MNWHVRNTYYFYKLSYRYFTQRTMHLYKCLYRWPKAAWYITTSYSDVILVKESFLLVEYFFFLYLCFSRNTSTWGSIKFRSQLLNLANNWFLLPNVDSSSKSILKFTNIVRQVSIVIMLCSINRHVVLYANCMQSENRFCCQFVNLMAQIQL